MRAVAAGLSKGQVVVTFYPPANSGGSAITGYVVVNEETGTRQAVTGSPATVTGLVSGTKTSFAVAAKNALGQGPCSEVSSVVVVP